MKNKNLLIALRVTYMFGGPIVAAYLNFIIGTKPCIIALVTLFSLLIANAIYQTIKSSNSDVVKAWLYRLCVWIVGIILAKYMQISFAGLLIYVLLFISFLFTYMENREIISYVEDFISDKRIRNLILIFSTLFIIIIIYTLITSGYEGLISLISSKTLAK
jgi:hypothetical protein